MVDKLLRVPKDTLLNPIAVRLLRNIHPTAITIAAFGVGIGAMLVIWRQYYAFGIALWLLNRLIDGLDGAVARLTAKQSDFGGYLDIVLDTVMYAAIPTALALSINTIPTYLALLFLLTTFYINGASWMYLAAILEKRSAGAASRGELTSVTMPSGLVEGAETIVFFVVFLLLPGAAVWLFAVMGVLTLATTLQRLLWAARTL